MKKSDLDKLRLELSLGAKNGVNFIVAAGVIWFAIAYIWTLSYSSYNKRYFTILSAGTNDLSAFGSFMNYSFCCAAHAFTTAMASSASTPPFNSIVSKPVLMIASEEVLICSCPAAISCAIEAP